MNEVLDEIEFAQIWTTGAAGASGPGTIGGGNCGSGARCGSGALEYTGSGLWNYFSGDADFPFQPARPRHHIANIGARHSIQRGQILR